MFTMKIVCQFAYRDRTMIFGEPTYDVFPKSIEIEGKCYPILRTGIEQTHPIYLLEIEGTDEYLVGKTAKDWVDSVDVDAEKEK